MITSVVSPKFQIVIPKAVRERLGVKPGATAAFIEPKPGVLQVFFPEEMDIRDLRGKYPGGPGSHIIEQWRREEG